MKQKSVRWAGHVARKGGFGNPQKFMKSRKKQASWKDKIHIKIGRSVLAEECVLNSSGSRLGSMAGFFFFFLKTGMKFVVPCKGCNYFINRITVSSPRRRVLSLGQLHSLLILNESQR
jgi:hypothetical protein